MVPQSNDGYQNPWAIQSIYDLMYFVCPTCTFKDSSKQKFVNHALKEHPEVEVNLLNVRDGSLVDVKCTWSISKGEVGDENENHDDEKYFEVLEIEYNNTEEMIKEETNDFNQDVDYSEDICETDDINDKDDSHMKTVNNSNILDEQREGFKSENCDTISQSRKGLQDHVRRVHGKTLPHKNRAHQCNKCTKAFSSASKLRKHVAEVCGGIQTFMCDQCPKTYTEKKNLLRHIRASHHSAPLIKVFV